MIQIKYAVTHLNNFSLGNKLFQYAFGRILAEKYNRRLVCDPIEGFPAAIPLGGNNISSIPYIVDGHIVDFGQLPKDKAWALTGYFHQYRYYKDYKSQIKEWFKSNYIKSVSNYGDLVFHYRSGDFREHNCLLSPKFCLDVLRQEDFNRLHIVTDFPSQLPKVFLDYDPVVISGNYLDDFAYMTKFDRIFISQSTFSWWAAWLSNASRILFPIPQNGYWSKQRPDVNLFVDDEDRYVKCYE